MVCLVCDGTGEKRRQADDVEWDAYLRLPLAEAAELPREPELARLPPPASMQDAYGWERAVRLQERHGSYRELRRQLDWLRQAHPRRHELIVAVLVEHEPRELSRRASLEVDLGVLALALRMSSVRVPRWLYEPAAIERRESLAALAAVGMKAGEIARALGIPKKVVRRRLKELQSRAAGAPARAA